MTNLSTVPYAYEPGLIASLLGLVLEAANAYGGKVTAYMKNRVSTPLIIYSIPIRMTATLDLLTTAFFLLYSRKKEEYYRRRRA